MKRVLAAFLFILLGTLAFSQVSIPAENRGTYTVISGTRDGNLWQVINGISIVAAETTISIVTPKSTLVLNVSEIIDVSDSADKMYELKFSNDSEVLLYNPDLMQLALVDGKTDTLIMVMQLTTGSAPTGQFELKLKQEPPLPSA